jgi:hypothetical protein
MTESQPIANRDEPIPIVAVSAPDDEQNEEGSRLRDKLKEKVEGLGHSRNGSDSSNKFQDRLLSM